MIENWIIKNKEWLFSGVGVFIIACTLKFIMNRLKQKNPEQSLATKPISNTNMNLNPSINININSNQNIDTKNDDSKNLINPIENKMVLEDPVIKPEFSKLITPAYIKKDVKNRPLYQQRDALKHYTGLYVDWMMKLSSVKEEKDGNIRVSLDFDPGILSAVFCTVKISDYPELKIMNEGTKIQVKGKIATIEENLVFYYLEEVKLIYTI
jgi:hypothetical protein